VFSFVLFGRNTSKITPVAPLSGGPSPSYTTPRDVPKIADFLDEIGRSALRPREEAG
jgi:hypothetical protein